MRTTEQTQHESSWFFDALGEVGEFGGRLLRSFFRVTGIGLLFTGVLTFSVYLGIAGEAAWRTAVACGAIFLLSIVLTLASGANLAVILSLAQTIRAKSLAKRVLAALFSELLGITDENPQGNYEQTQRLHGLPIEELRTLLKSAGRKVLDHPAAAWLPRIVRWLMRKAEQLLVWGTVRVVIAYATAQAGQDQKVDLLALRENLAAVVDDLVTRRITAGAIRMAFVLALVATTVAWAIVGALVRFGPS